MSRLHEIVVEASETTNLEQLAALLVEACQIIVKEQTMPPFKHWAVRFVCFQIAFAGDGDHQAPFYSDILRACHFVLNEDEQGEVPNEPSRQAS